MSLIAQPLLEQIAAAPGGVATRSDLAAQLERTPNLITGAALLLRRRKLVEFAQRGVYRITEAGRDWLTAGHSFAGRTGTRRGARTRGLRARAWWVMRELHKFTVAARSIVYLASRECPVDTDKLYSLPDASHVRCPEARLGLWPVLTGFAVGVMATIAIALLVPPAKAVPPESIVIDCDEPGAEPAEKGVVSV